MATLAAGSTTTVVVNVGQSVRIQAAHNVTGKITFTPKTSEPTYGRGGGRSFGPLPTDQEFGPWDKPGICTIQNDAGSSAAITYTISTLTGVTTWQQPQVLMPYSRTQLVFDNTNKSNTTQHLIFSSQVPYAAVQIGIVHGGIDGTTGTNTGVKVIVASTDSVGDLNYGTMGNASTRLANTPKRAGTTYNTLVSDGTPGWRSVTWGGAASPTLTDQGASGSKTFWSDIIPVDGIDAVQTKQGKTVYPILMRLANPLNGYLGYWSVPNGGNMYTTDNFAQFLVSQIIFTTQKTASDAVTTLANITDANTLTPVQSPSIILRVFPRDLTAKSIMVVGDSRLHIGGADVPTDLYKSTSYLLSNELTARGINHYLQLAGYSGAVGDQYDVPMYQMLPPNTDSTPDYLVYLAWSANDYTAGGPTQALASLAMYRVAKLMDKVKNTNTKVIFIPYLFNNVGWTTQQMALLNSVADYCRNFGQVVDLSAIGSTVTGAYNSGLSDGTGNHMNQTGYTLLAKAIANTIY